MHDAREIKKPLVRQGEIMNLIKCYQTNSTWYKSAKAGSKPVGVLWHDTACGNPTLKRYVQPHETDANYDEMITLLGKNKYGNDWNHIDHEAGLNAWIGKLADGTIATIQAGDWDKHPWGCGSGNKGSYTINNGKKTWTNEHWIQFEICDDGYKDVEYFQRTYKEACEFTAYICELYNIDPNGTVIYNGVEVPTILCHADSYKLGLGGNHGDIYSWFKKFGYDMTNVRNDVASLMKKDSTTGTNAPSVVFEIGDTVKIKDGVTTYYDGTTMASWVPKSKLYVRALKSNNRVVISTLQEGDITGTVFAKDLVLVQKANPPKEDKQIEQEPVQTVAGKVSTGSKVDEKKLWDFLYAKIGNEYGVAGLMGNLYAESALRSNNLQNTYEKSLGYTDDAYTVAVDNGSYTNFVNDRAGYGLAQWTYWSRKQGLIEYAKSVGKSICDFDMQMEFLFKELSENYKATLNVLKSAQSVADASTYVLIHFEAPADQGETVQNKRAGYGEKYYEAYHTAVEVPEENNNVSSEETNEEKEPEYIKTPEETEGFLRRLLNYIIDFIVKHFAK